MLHCLKHISTSEQYRPSTLGGSPFAKIDNWSANGVCV